MIYMQITHTVMSDSLGLHGLPVHEIPFPSPGDLPNPGIELRSPALQADSLPTETITNIYLFHSFWWVFKLERNFMEVFHIIIRFIPQYFI